MSFPGSHRQDDQSRILFGRLIPYTMVNKSRPWTQPQEGTKGAPYQRNSALMASRASFGDGAVARTVLDNNTHDGHDGSRETDDTHLL